MFFCRVFSDLHIIELSYKERNLMVLNRVEAKALHKRQIQIDILYAGTASIEKSFVIDKGILFLQEELFFFLNLMMCI